MIRAKFCFVAEGVIRDAESNSISVFTILEGVASEGFPFFIQRISFFTLWERDTEDADEVRGTFTLTIGEETLITQSVNVPFAGKRRNRTTINLRGLVVPRPGTLRFLIVLDGGAQSEYLLEVIPREQTPAIPQDAGNG